MDEYEYLKKLCKDRNNYDYNKSFHDCLIQKGFQDIDHLSDHHNPLLTTLNKDKIYRLINDKSLLIYDNFHIIYKINSTNKYIKEIQNKQYSVVAAEYQTSAYGRRGNQWFGNLLQQLSFSIKFKVKNKNLSLLPIYLALEVAKFLSSHKIKSVQVKWPNDILISGKKCAGLMIEAIRCGNESSYILGMGINIFNLNKQLDKEICSISEYTKDNNLLDRNLCLSGLLNVLLPALNSFSILDENNLFKEFNQYNVLYDTKFSVKQHDEMIYQASYKQLNPDGSLQVVANGKIMNIYSAEVSLIL